MLKTALSPRSLAFLLVSLIVATAFVLLSIWQLDSSRQAATVADPTKDRVKPLIEVLRPGEITTVDAADHMVSVTGRYVAGSTITVPGRLYHGERGHWVITQFVPQRGPSWDVADAPVSVAVARGWVASADQVPAAPSEPVTVVGRLLPQEAPLADHHLPGGQLPTVSPAQLTNLWNAPLYSGYVAAAAEAPADQPPPVTRDGTVDVAASEGGDELRELEIDQQPTDTSVSALNIFYALEWILFAGFAVFLWWRFVRDEYLRKQNPDQYFYLEGDYFWDEAAQSFYYWDEPDQCYYYFDDQPATRSGTDRVSASTHRTHPDLGATHE